MDSAMSNRLNHARAAYAPRRAVFALLAGMLFFHFWIPAAPSTYARLDESLTHLTEKLDRGLDKIDRLLSEQNLQNVAGILSEMKALPQDLRSQLHGFKLLVDSSIVMEEGITQAFDKVESAALGVEKMVGNLEHDYADPNQNMTTLVRQNLETFHQLLYELDVLVGDMQRATRAIEASPSDLIFKRSRLQPGPGEEGYDKK